MKVRQQQPYIVHVHGNLSDFQETHYTFMVGQIASLPYHLTCWFPFFCPVEWNIFFVHSGTNHCHDAAKTNACNLLPRRWSLLLHLPSEDMGLGIAHCGGDDGTLIAPKLNHCVINQKAHLNDNACVNVLHPGLIAICELGSFSGHCSVSVSNPVIFLHVVGHKTKFVAAVCITLSSRCDIV